MATKKRKKSQKSINTLKIASIKDLLMDGSKEPSTNNFTPSDSASMAAIQSPTNTPDSGLTCDRHFMINLMERHTKTICDKVEALTSRVTDLEVAVEENSNQISDIANKARLYDQAVEDIKALKEKVMLSEIYSRRANILIYGIPNQTANLTAAIKEVFTRILHLDPNDVDSIQFTNIHRLPSHHKKGDRPDPVIVNFLRQTDRDRIMNARFTFY